MEFYTGLRSFAMLLAVFELFEGSVQGTPRNVLSKFQELLVTLVRLRLGVPLQELAYRINIGNPYSNTEKNFP